MFHERTTHAARGKWRGILIELGVPAEVLVDKHSKCPLCEREGKFRWDNKEGSGSYICVCGAGFGIDLAMEFTGAPFREVADRIDAMLGNMKPDGAPQGREISDEEQREICRRIWLETKPVEAGDLVHKYLASRGVDEVVYPAALRFGAALRDGEGGVRPCMVAMVGVPGKPRYAAMHRTFLKPDGSGKAEMESPRKMTRGVLPEGACVQLSEYVPGGVLGIAEGIETAMSASILFEMPVWSALNTSLMKRWLPPEGCKQVVIFGDNDPAYGGQAAAYQLAHRLAIKHISVSVRLPSTTGTDWNDVLMNKAPM